MSDFLLHDVFLEFTPKLHITESNSSKRNYKRKVLLIARTQLNLIVMIQELICTF